MNPRCLVGTSVLIFGLLFHPLKAMNLRLEIDLSGEWLFEIGDNPEYAKPAYEDRHWEIIRVPNLWENEGFPGYDGYAWYRLHFIMPAQLKEKTLYLKLGRIDDVDQTYLNGSFIGGEGSFPPRYQTAYDVKRIYPLEKTLIRFGGENVLAVRVLDTQLAGGIVEGEVGIYSRQDVLPLLLDLSGPWNFKIGDDPQWADPASHDGSWSSIRVPGCWENQGYDYDGFAWYRRSFRIDPGWAKSKLILLLGNIDDVDEVYLNGVLIGRTGYFPEKKGEWAVRSFNDIERAYFLPPSEIRFGRDNVVAIRVFDRDGLGGITHGYVGLTTREHYLKYAKNRKD